MQSKIKAPHTVQDIKDQPFNEISKLAINPEEQFKI